MNLAHLSTPSDRSNSSDTYNLLSCSRGNNPRKCCECNDNCWTFKTCCIDQLWNPLHPVNLQSYIDSFLKLTTGYKNVQCIKAFPFISTTRHARLSYFMVASCSVEEDLHDVNVCLNGMVSSSYIYIDGYTRKSEKYVATS